MSERIPVVLIFGGQSSEHEISCLTAAGVVAAIDRDRFDIHGIGITRDGHWVRYESDQIAALTAQGRELPHVDGTGDQAVLSRTEDGVRLATRVGDRLVDEVAIEVAFPLLHGPFGEDGTIQGQLEMLGLAYVGAGVAASAVGMDKHLMKVVLDGAGLPIAPYVVLLPGEWQRHPQVCLKRIAALRFPLFVKPTRAGSSIGISRVTSSEALPAAIEQALRHDPKLIIEQGLVGVREIECAVLGPRNGDAPRASRPGEIMVRADDAFYDFENKYLADDQVELAVPADVTPELEARIQDAAIRTFIAIGAEGLSRVDVFVDADDQVIVSEINTMPGFTRISMFPMMWRATGLGYRDLISDLIDQARSRPLGLR